ncbi:MAG: tetratricopeptide repeat protein [Wenzhouxiangellaceae bacterium]|nr:tetratricopeptide repeat protein [Wenzhouxiangellaceae bacterium]
MSAPDAGLSRQAFRVYQAGNYAQAEPMFQRLAEQDPGNWQYRLVIGLCRHAQGDVQSALPHVEKAVALGDGQPTTHYYYGRLLTDMRRPEEAREQFAQAIALDPNHVEARTGMGLVSLMTGNFKRAAGEFKTALRANDKHVPALAAAARALLEMGEIEEAAPYASKAVQLQPDNPVAQDTAGRVFLNNGQLGFAEQCFRNALQAKPDSGEIHAALADALRLQQRDGEALDHYVKALERDAGGAETVINCSISLERVGDLDQARSLMRKARQRWPDDVAIGLRLVELTMLAGRPDEALELLATMDAQDPQVRTLRARIIEAQGDAAGAREVLEAVVAEDADCQQREARLLLARVLSGQNPADLDRARAPIAPLLDRERPIPDAMLVWSMLSERAGDYEQACATLEQMLTTEGISDADRAVLHNRLGNCYDQADERTQAWANWQKGQWWRAPNAPRLESQRQSGMLDRWLDHAWQALEVAAPDDGLRAPVIVAGWPGSGRDVLLPALAAHPEVGLLDPAAEIRRLESLGVPLAPEEFSALDEAAMRLGRKRFMRGAAADAAQSVLLDGGWWEASAIPALAHHFPGTRVVLCMDDPDDMVLQWRVMGYAGIDQLEAEYRREFELWQRMREHLPLEIVEIARADWCEGSDAAVARVLDALGLPVAPEPLSAGHQALERQRFVPSGRGARYT